MSKRHVYEIDFMRAFVMFCVVCVHVTTVFQKTAPTGSASYLGLGTAIATFHFTRESFMFVTGIVLLITYYHRSFRMTEFWKKRFLLIGVPYLVWTVVYVLFKGLYYHLHHYFGPSEIAHNIFLSVFTGSQYYLYFLFVSMQLYILFPLMVKGLRRFERYHVHIFIGSFVLQLLLMSLYRFGLSQIHAPFMHQLLPAIHHYSGSFILMYQFWFVAGGVLACHYEQIRDWVMKHARLVMSLFVLIILINAAHYLAVLLLEKKPDYIAQMVFQPIMLPYCLVTTVGLLVIGCAWASRRMNLGWKRFSSFVELASKTSFGILLIQPILIVFVRSILTHLDQLGIPGWVHFSLWPISDVAVYLVAMGLSNVIGKVRVFSYVVGRKADRAVVPQTESMRA